MNELASLAQINQNIVESPTNPELTDKYMDAALEAFAENTEFVTTVLNNQRQIEHI